MSLNHLCNINKSIYSISLNGLNGVSFVSHSFGLIFSYRKEIHAMKWLGCQCIRMPISWKWNLYPPNYYIFSFNYGIYTLICSASCVYQELSGKRTLFFCHVLFSGYTIQNSDEFRCVCVLSIKHSCIGNVQLMIFIEAFITMFVHVQMLETIRFNPVLMRYVGVKSTVLRRVSAIDDDIDVCCCCCCYCINAKRTLYIYWLIYTVNALQHFLIHSALPFAVHLFNCLFNYIYAQFNHFDTVRFALLLSKCQHVTFSWQILVGNVGKAWMCIRKCTAHGHTLMDFNMR